MSLNSFWQNTLANTLGTLIASVIAGIFSFIFINPIRQWIYKNDPKLSKLLLKVLDFIYQPVLWLIVFFICQISTILNFYRYWGIGISIAVFIRFYLESKSKTKVYPSRSSQFSDGFHKLEDISKNWETITGKPTLDKRRGKPKPSLQLLKDSSQATNTFLILKKITAEKGEIECDVFLEKGALINIVFMCDKKSHNWHMARFDSRGGTSDGFLIKDAGKGNNWRFNNMSTSRINSGSWYKVKIEYSPERARMFRNGELISEIINPQIFGKHIGLFNECANVSVDNFKFNKG